MSTSPGLVAKLERGKFRQLLIRESGCDASHELLKCIKSPLDMYPPPHMTHSSNAAHGLFGCIKIPLGVGLSASVTFFVCM